MVEQTQKHCPQCNQYTLHARPGTNHLLHLIVTVFLCGAWIPIWILSSLKIGGWRCQSCGKGSSGIKMLIAIIFTLFLGFVILSGLKSCANSLKNQEKYAQKAEVVLNTNSNSESVPKIAKANPIVPPIPEVEKVSPKLAPETQSNVPESANKIIADDDVILSNLDGAVFPLNILVVRTCSLRDEAGKETTIFPDTKIVVNSRSAKGILTLKINGVVYVGDESRILDKVKKLK